jgi:hypothetical protein
MNDHFEREAMVPRDFIVRPGPQSRMTWEQRSRGRNMRAASDKVLKTGEHYLSML